CRSTVPGAPGLGTDFYSGLPERGRGIGMVAIRTGAVACIFAAAACGGTSMRTTGTSEARISYPVTTNGTVVDDYFGAKIADPYRWMESLDDKQVADWVAAQNKVTFGHLDQLPLRDRFKKRITELWDYPKVTLPVKE